MISGKSGRTKPLAGYLLSPAVRNLMLNGTAGIRMRNSVNIMIWMHNSETKLDHLLSHLPLGVSFESIGPDADIGKMREATKLAEY